MTLLRSPSSGGSWLPVFCCVASGVVIAVGSVVLLGWAIGLTPLIRPLPTTVAMNPVTAVLFVLAGACLWRLAGCRPGGSGRERDGLGLVLALLVAAAGALRVADYLFHFNLQLEHLLFAKRVALLAPSLPAELAPNTAMDFLLCGVALVLFDRETPRRLWVGQASGPRLRLHRPGGPDWLHVPHPGALSRRHVHSDVPGNRGLLCGPLAGVSGGPARRRVHACDHQPHHRGRGCSAALAGGDPDAVGPGRGAAHGRTSGAPCARLCAIGVRSGHGFSSQV